MDYTYDLRTDTFVLVVLDVGRGTHTAPGGCGITLPTTESGSGVRLGSRTLERASEHGIEHASEHGYPFLMPNGESPCDGC